MQTWEVFAVFATQPGEDSDHFVTLFRVKAGETVEGTKAKVAGRIPPAIVEQGLVKVLHGTLMVDPTPVDLGVPTN